MDKHKPAQTSTSEIAIHNNELCIPEDASYFRRFMLNMFKTVEIVPVDRSIRSIFSCASFVMVSAN